MPVEDMEAISHAAYQNGFQVGIHAIGDRANREVLIFSMHCLMGVTGACATASSMLNISTLRISRVLTTGVIASMQGIHMSSDRPWAIDRLGLKRIKEGAYMWRSLGHRRRD